MEYLYRLYRTYSISSTACFAFLMIILYHAFLPKRKYSNITPAKYAALGVVIFTALFQGVLLTVSPAELIFSNPFHYLYFFLCMVIPSITLSHLFLEGKLFSKLIYILFFTASIQVFRGLCIPIYRLENVIESNVYLFLDLFMESLLFLFLYGLMVLFRKHPIEIEPLLDNRTRTAMLYLPLSVHSAIMLPAFFPDMDIYYIYIIFFLDIPILYYLFAIHYNELVKVNIAMTKARANRDAYERTDELRKKIRQERHELKNEYFRLQILLHDKKYEELETQLEAVIGKTNKNLKSLETGSTYLDYLILQKESLATDSNIPFQVDITLPESTSFDETAAGTVLANLLDNAIEASRKEKDSAIHVTIKTINGYFFCEVRNRIGNNVFEKNPFLTTTKTDSESHGYGLKIIRKTLAEAKGIFDLTVDNGDFVASFMLPLLEKNKLDNHKY